MPLKSGIKRRWILRRLGSFMGLADDTPQLSIRSGGFPNLDAHSPFTEDQAEGVTDDANYPQGSVMATVPQPTVWLKGVDLDAFWETIQRTFCGPDTHCQGLIAIFPEELFERNRKVDPDSSCSRVGSLSGTEPATSHDGLIDDSAKDDGKTAGKKGFSSLFDGGAAVGIISVDTLGQLERGYTSRHHLHPEQRVQVGIQSIGAVYEVVGLVPILWYMNAFPSVIFSTTFAVVDKYVPYDLIIGRDVMQAAYAAAKQEARGRGLVEWLKRHYAIGLR